MTRFDLVDVMVFVGLGLMAAGLAAFDWRLALLVCGALLFVFGLYAGWRAAR
jgi:hypothetical protein